jgi:tRNA nucleotidyltransferase (CCA-adding enzyme)
MDNWPEHIQFIFNELSEHGYEVYAVGGCVRDMIMKITPRDFDMVCSATPVQISNIFSRSVSVGEKHGTIIVLIDQQKVEVSTYRHINLNKKLSALENDLAGRDFTINAMAMDVNGVLYDPWGGQGDLEAGLIRATCDRAEELFADDPLRMMRAVRFAVTYDYQIDNTTYAAILKTNYQISEIAKERIREELNMIITSYRPADGIRKLQACGLMRYIIPELEIMAGFDQRNFRHDKDLFEHSLAVLEGVPPRIDVRLAALLHDIGKPDCFTVDENGVGHFYNHHLVGMELTRTILKRLKYDGQTIKDVSLLVGFHMTRYAKLRSSSLKQLINQVGENNLNNMYELQKADILGSAPPFDFTELDKMQREIDNILNTQQPLTVKDLAINGDDLVEIGYTPGKILGEILQRLLNEVLEDPIQNQPSLLLKLAHNWKDETGN